MVAQGIHLQCRRCGFSPWVGKIPWRRKWQPRPGFLPGNSHGERSLLGYSPWGRKRVNLATKQQHSPSFMEKQGTNFPQFLSLPSLTCPREHLWTHRQGIMVSHFTQFTSQSQCCSSLLIQLRIWCQALWTSLLHNSDQLWNVKLPDSTIKQFFCSLLSNFNVLISLS